MKFVLTQLDTSGKIIDSSVIEYKDIDFLPNSVYSHPEGIVIKDECADFTVNVLYAVSKKYKYVNKHNGTAVTYDVRGYDTNPIIGDSASHAKVKRVKPGAVFYGFLALIATLLLALACYITFAHEDDSFAQPELYNDSFEIETDTVI